MIQLANLGSRRDVFWRTVKHQKIKILLVLPFLIYVIVFMYVPVGGWIRAFYDFKPARVLSECDFVGFRFFEELFTSPGFWRALKNTLIIAFMNLILGTLCTITFAIFLNEIRTLWYKRVIQTVSYLPHFVSWVVVIGIFTEILSVDGGLLNELLLKIGVIREPLRFLLTGKWYYYIVTFMSIWKEMGWSAIIYLAVMSSINPSLYEAAFVDGAGRFKRIWHVTLPGLKNIIIIMLVLQTGWVLNVGFEQSILLANGAIIKNSDVLSTYIMRYGLQMGRFSFATAAGIFQSLVGVSLVLFANLFAKRIGDYNVLS
ncbi:MAG: ABC transporter permease subunit [Clostridia bacterium]|nr:ABC transporter permease subunit [Clostridia bacterium]